MTKNLSLVEGQAKAAEEVLNQVPQGQQLSPRPFKHLVDVEKKTIEKQLKSQKLKSQKLNSQSSSYSAVEKSVTSLMHYQDILFLVQRMKIPKIF